MWQAALPSTSNHFNRPFPASTNAFPSNHASEAPPKRSSLHENQLAQLTDSFDSGVQLKSNSSSNSSQPPPPAPFISDFSNMDENGSQDRFLAPSAQRINKMRVQLSRKNSDDSNSSIRMRSHSNVQSSLLNARRFRGRSTASSSTTDGDEFAGLPEAAVDSDDDDDEEESIPSHDFSYMELKDNVRECLEKEPAERSSDDIHVLMVRLWVQKGRRSVVADFVGGFRSLEAVF
uniref:WAPL domain-containing protein n=1 Tax=Bursaphelenchus xylophilus TaxID=6326 RepID=A0A1I7SH56_BURXY